MPNGEPLFEEEPQEQEVYETLTSVEKRKSRGEEIED
jgi:hypothetical protein